MVIVSSIYSDPSRSTDVSYNSTGNGRSGAVSTMAHLCSSELLENLGGSNRRKLRAIQFESATCKTVGANSRYKNFCLKDKLRDQRMLGSSSKRRGSFIARSIATTLSMTMPPLREIAKLYDGVQVPLCSHSKLMLEMRNV